MKKLKMLTIPLIIAILTFILTGCSSETKATKNLNVFAAISLKDSLGEITKLYQQDHPEIKITYNFASSGTLQKQIEEGAPVDLFISAGKKQMDDLSVKGLIKKDTSANMVGNKLVLITPTEETVVKDFKSLVHSGIKIAIGTPETVPAGTYARETLQKMGLWDNLKDNIVYTKDVRQVLTYVENGDVNAGLVYKSDALISKKIKIVAEAPGNSHKSIVYPAAVTEKAALASEAKAFLGYLKSDKVQKVFQQFGFSKP